MHPHAPASSRPHVLADKYFESDFDWQLHESVCSPIIFQQQQQQQQKQQHSGSRPLHLFPASRHHVEPWEDFHFKSGASFYKERRYILREFPLLLHHSPPYTLQTSGTVEMDPHSLASTFVQACPEKCEQARGEKGAASREHQTHELPTSPDLPTPPEELSCSRASHSEAANRSTIFPGGAPTSPSQTHRQRDATISEPQPTSHPSTGQTPANILQALSSDSDSTPASPLKAESPTHATPQLQRPALPPPMSNATSSSSSSPEPASPPTPIHIVELGCGSGASLLPILRANPHCHVTGTDISPTSLQHFLAAARRAGIAPERVHTFAADTASASQLARLGGLAAHILLIVFTLSALSPGRQSVMLGNAHACLVPGGHLMIRDHGLYDMAQMRMEGGQWLGEGQSYARKDGTLAYFFSVEELCARASDAGFQVLECKYATVRNVNRKTGAVLDRVFIHGLFVRGG
ncbi:MAG: hypothetical protein WDW38_009989 [Sanguina aurantia]